MAEANDTPAIETFEKMVESSVSARRRVGAATTEEKSTTAAETGSPTSSKARPRTMGMWRRQGTAMILALVGATLFLSDDAENDSEVELSPGMLVQEEDSQGNWTSSMPADPIVLEPGQAWSRPPPTTDELFAGNKTSPDQMKMDSGEIPSAKLRTRGTDSALMKNNDKHPSATQDVSLDEKEGKEKCLISSAPIHGIGYQLEAKISCIGAAAMSPHALTYIHQPFSSDRQTVGRNVTSSENADDTMESFFDISGALDALDGLKYDAKSMEYVERTPVPHVGSCEDSSWFDAVNESGCHAVSLDTINSGMVPVFEANNCWDDFWCRLARDPNEAVTAWRERALPALRESYRQGAARISISNEDLFGLAHTKELSHHEEVLNVVVHVRKSQAGSHTERLTYYDEILTSLRRAASEMRESSAVNKTLNAKAPLLRIVVHTNDNPVEVAAGLDFNISAATAKGDSLSVSQLDDGATSATIHGRSTSLPLVFQHMIECDIFIASRSSLSNSAALLRDDLDEEGGAGVIYPETRQRLGILSLGWTMMQLNEEGSLKMGEIRSPKVMGGKGIPLGLHSNSSSTRRLLMTKKEENEQY
mmetsp:Transcript_38988/g.117224  ORF Transcript_38988/g.117224 Transcript_38988/m.117224 type:complete len:591 (-) Transcript_38988:327-2099(-)